MTEWKFQRPEDFDPSSPLGMLWGAFETAEKEEAAARAKEDGLAAQRQAAENWLADARLGADELEFARLTARLVLLGRASVEAHGQWIRAKQRTEGAKQEWTQRWMGYQRLATAAAGQDAAAIARSEKEAQLVAMTAAPA